MSIILQPCAVSGCSTLVQTGRCKDHQREAYRTKQKPEASAKNYDWQWRKLRTFFIKRFPLCVLCLGAGKIVKAAEVHHVVPIAVDPSRRLDTKTLKNLCTDCHDAQHGRQEVRTYIDD